MARKPNQPDMFAEPEGQGELFEAPMPKSYVPEPSHVRNRLAALLAAMKASDTWPWDEAIVALHRERTFGYLCGLLAESEGGEWQAQIDAEVARLDAATHIEPSVAAE